MAINLSIIIPVYNKEAYLASCLDSILSQSYRDYEVILIDDGSKDSSKSIAQKYEAKDSRIHLFSYENKGVSTARNRGLDKASGCYILFIDSDDWIEPDYLDKIMAQAESNPADILIWGISKEGADGKTTIKNPLMKGMHTQKTFFSHMIQEQYGPCQGLYGYISNKLLKKDIISQFNLAFNPNYKLQEDYDFFLHYYAHCQSFYCFELNGYHYVTGTNFSSGQMIRQVDYLSLLSIQSFALDIIQNIIPEDLAAQEILKTILGQLSEAGYLEMNPVTYQKIKDYSEGLSLQKQALSAYHSYVTKRKVLKSAVMNRQYLLLFAYLKLWRNYLSFRTKNS